MKYSVETNALAIGYGKTPLLSDICLGVQPGQILTLIGPNGAGKSTLLKTLAGQLAAQILQQTQRKDSLAQPA